MKKNTCLVYVCPSVRVMPPWTALITRDGRRSALELISPDGRRITRDGCRLAGADH
jgi:hypothetical protein